ncbi:bile acid:sodium symporter family protein [Aquisphaera insulae]|uniref:bile acid:sodium symporter family protein n=1 Tax=Aquisphaera insulae TaxID=2712864 RepID=UPI0013EC1259|nr:bile acid:sodium symporter [Aquisphaera insulae]
MTPIPDRLSAVSHFLHRHLLKLILLSYGLAAALPGPGLRIKESDVLGLFGLPGGSGVTAPKVLLGLLLFNAGLRVRVGRIGQLAGRPGMVLAGLAANLAVPTAFLALMIPMLGAWHNPDEAAVVLVGLALVSSMPIAGSSAGWAQAADGDMALSLGLVLGSTLLSPLSTPATLHALGLLAPGAYAGQLHQLAGRGTGTFLAAWVLLPSVLGIAARATLGEGLAPAVERRLKVVAPATLMILCYANASACLPQAIRNPDWDFLVIVLAFVTGLCTLTFAAGHLVGRLVGADRAQRVALMFGLGMNNNGTGLVLASTAMAATPLAMLPIIVYNLAQHLIAGGVDALLRRADPA